MIRLDAAACARLPGLWARGLVVRRRGDAQTEPLPEPVTVLDPSWTLDNLKDDDVAAGFRKVSWAVGVDPTKNRPSGEALARRILNGNALPVIHPLVDAYNLGSAATLVPIGAYDLDTIEAPITIRPARAGESFHGIGRAPEPLEEGRVVYVSADGVVCGVLMWRDAQASMIRPTTGQALLLTVGADPVPAEAGVRGLERAAECARRVGYDPVDDVIVAKAA